MEENVDKKSRVSAIRNIWTLFYILTQNDHQTNDKLLKKSQTMKYVIAGYFIIWELLLLI